MTGTRTGNVGNHKKGREPQELLKAQEVRVTVVSRDTGNGGGALLLVRN